MSVFKVTTVGNSVGVILPKEILERLRVGKGDTIGSAELRCQSVTINMPAQGESNC